MPQRVCLSAWLTLSLLLRCCRADVPICTHQTMGDYAFCFPPDYNKVRDTVADVWCQWEDYLHVKRFP